MNKNALSTLISAAIFFLVIYMFKDQLKAVFSGNKLGNTTRGIAALGVPTFSNGSVYLDSLSGELYSGLGVPGQPEANPKTSVTIGPNGEINVQ